MFDIGFLEVVLILIVALLVIGPKQLPQLAQTCGALVRKAKQWLNQTKDILNDKPDDEH